MTFSTLLLLTIYLVLPIIFLFELWKCSLESKLEWILLLVSSALFIVWICVAGPWSWFGYYLRYVLLVIVLIVSIVSWRKVRNYPFLAKYKGHRLFSMLVHGILIVVFGLYLVFVAHSFSTVDRPIALSFPLKNGIYYVGQGGNHVLMNYHHAHPAQRYALDILQLNRLGLRAQGFYPDELEKYEIYGAKLYSPCSGEVKEVRDGLPDLIPPNTNSEQPKGNYIALQCVGEEALIYMAHLQQGSINVEEGASVETGDWLALVGNSGNTSEPHLHIHAELDGQGVPLTFEGRFLVRNQLVRQK